jgi:hypothetical protein
LKNRSLNKNSNENSLFLNRVEKNKEAPTLSDEFSSKKKLEGNFLKSYYGAKISEQIKEGAGIPRTFGTHIYRNGDRYEGELLDGKKNGKGTYFYKNGDRYVGDWVNDNQTGKGGYYWSQDEKYEGEFLNGKKHGYGAYYFKNGDKYVGDWVHNCRTGYGKLYFKNGDYYEGFFLNDKKEGWGTYFCKVSDNDQVVNSDPNHKNIYDDFNFNENGSKYVGNWVEGKKSGFGQLLLASGDRYEGNFLNGKICGEGVFFFKSGDNYAGEFYFDSISGMMLKCLKLQLNSRLFFIFLL